MRILLTKNQLQSIKKVIKSAKKKKREAFQYVRVETKGDVISVQVTDGTLLVKIDTNAELCPQPIETGIYSIIGEESMCNPMFLTHLIKSELTIDQYPDTESFFTQWKYYNTLDKGYKFSLDLLYDKKSESMQLSKIIAKTADENCAFDYELLKTAFGFIDNDTAVTIRIVNNDNNHMFICQSEANYKTKIIVLPFRL
jgi:hypothetical protein